MHYWLSNLRSKIKYRPNRLHIKTLNRGWVDRDHQLLHACMQIMMDFVEQEKRDDIVDWNWDEDHRKAAATLERLYYWWKHDPFAQDASIMPPYSDWLSDYDIEVAPFEVIENWLDRVYANSENAKWAKKIVNEVKKKKFDEIDENTKNRRRYYNCLLEIENEAVRRQDKALKDLINIRGYLWT